ncbi:BLOC-1-related complex subunit 6 [Cimex lectularius]|uniref:BLOC-1-related complex subunit 6 C-terminal helix domain-containing protein n=1 Tax=Cimex lectularius TaxID=79782 RepID=A0A8I6TJE8_CIMLE|nr:BLOC-1-related complex subunit 6 [Cimex lectularius]
MDEMTASYSEICDGPDDDLERCEELPLERPQVLKLPESSKNVSKPEEFLKQLDGTITRNGEMISFIAGNLEEKIKLSSPTTATDFYWNRQTTGEAKLLEELELEASVLAASVDSLTEALAETLHSISALTVDCLESYRDVVCKACDAVDTNIKAMYQLMAKCEEMSKSMAPIYKLSSHIKNIKHLLDVFEAIPR